MNIFVDVLVIGTGAAGINLALNLNKDLKVLLLSKSKLMECNSYLAQGGIAVARGKYDEEAFINDTLKAGRFKNDYDAVETLVKESRENIDALIKLGMKFDTEENGLHYTREGGHSLSRIVHSKDETGRKVMESLIVKMKEGKNITVFEECCFTDLICSNNRCYGGRVFKEEQQINIYSKQTVIATGGIGGIFKNSTNQRCLTGDGIAVALKNSVKVKNLNYIQIHPTALYEEKTSDRRLLISESLRGEGAKLININGERFIDELLPRDIVSKSIIEEQMKTKTPYVFLDISFMADEYIKQRFSSIYIKCLEKGIDICKDLIPVTPVQHYLMGGIEVDLNSRTSMDNLFACGEVSCTGVHGANRLASNSLLEALVFSKRAANEINQDIYDVEINKIDISDRKMDLYEEQDKNRNIIIEELKKVWRNHENELAYN